MSRNRTFNVTAALTKKYGKYYAVVSFYVQGKRKQKWIAYDGAFNTVGGINKIDEKHFLSKQIDAFTNFIDSPKITEESGPDKQKCIAYDGTDNTVGGINKVDEKHILSKQVDAFIGFIDSPKSIEESDPDKQKCIAYDGAYNTVGGINKVDEKHILSKQVVAFTDFIDSPKSIEESGPDKDTLFSDFIEFWYESLPEETDIITLQGYRCLLDVHFLSYFKGTGITIYSLSQHDIQAFIDHERWHGNHSRTAKEELSSTSVNKILKMMRSILRCAEARNICSISPTISIDHPKPKKPKLQYYDSNELNELLDLSFGTDLYPLIYFAAIYGLRRSELLGIQWPSVDADRFTIENTVVKCTGKEIIKNGKTKSESSHRTMLLTPEAKLIFISAKNKEEYYRTYFGDAYNDNQFVFKQNDGTPYHPDHVTRMFKHFLQKNGLRVIRFHDLRHSCATYLYNELHLPLEEISDWLGHSDVNITKDIYIHQNIERSPQITECFSNNFKNRTQESVKKAEEITGKNAQSAVIIQFNPLDNPLKSVREPSKGQNLDKWTKNMKP